MSRIFRGWRPCSGGVFPRVRAARLTRVGRKGGNDLPMPEDNARSREAGRAIRGRRRSYIPSCVVRDRADSEFLSGVALSCVLRACSRRANCRCQVAAKNWPASFQAACYASCLRPPKKYFPLACISLLGPFLARKPLIVPRTTGGKRGFSAQTVGAIRPFDWVFPCYFAELIRINNSLIFIHASQDVRA